MTDGIETPENMLRCMSNNYSALAFWRAWHRSFNRWTIRYIYIPLGGSKRLIVNTLAVFTFVAFWHDISLKLLAWGWLVTLFILPEVAARMIMPPKKVTPCMAWCVLRLRPLVDGLRVVEWVALLSTCLCHCCGSECLNDDGCQFNWVLCRIRRYCRLTKRDNRELFWYVPPLFLQGLFEDIGLMVGWALMVGVFASLFVGVQVMFEIREDERRRGINLRC